MTAVNRLFISIILILALFGVKFAHSAACLTGNSGSTTYTVYKNTSVNFCVNGPIPIKMKISSRTCEPVLYPFRLLVDGVVKDINYVSTGENLGYTETFLGKHGQYITYSDSSYEFGPCRFKKDAADTVYFGFDQTLQGSVNCSQNSDLGAPKSTQMVYDMATIKVDAQAGKSLSSFIGTTAIGWNLAYVWHQPSFTANDAKYGWNVKLKVRGAKVPSSVSLHYCVNDCESDNLLKCDTYKTKNVAFTQTTDGSEKVGNALFKLSDDPWLKFSDTPRLHNLSIVYDVGRFSDSTFTFDSELLQSCTVDCYSVDTSCDAYTGTCSCTDPTYGNPPLCNQKKAIPTPTPLGGMTPQTIETIEWVVGCTALGLIIVAGIFMVRFWSKQQGPEVEMTSLSLEAGDGDGDGDGADDENLVAEYNRIEDDA